MIRLLVPIDERSSGRPTRLPVSENAARHLEWALLAADVATRNDAIFAAFDADANVGAWAIATTEYGLGRTINHRQEAVDWLIGRLEHELAAALSVEPPPANDVELRLLALVKKLAWHSQRASDFDTRLQREKLDSLKELAYGASHEINNPLANIAARAQSLLEDEKDSERRRKLTAIHRQAMRAHEMISDLMLFARPPKLVLAPCDLGQVTSTVVDQLRDLADEYGAAIELGIQAEPFEVLADETQIAVAIHAVVLNAIESAGRGGHIEVLIRNPNGHGTQLAEIFVSDNGPGISDAIRPHIFDPFFSGREAGRGLGFGLSKCWRIVTDHGGQIVAHRGAARGAQISIFLPLSQSPAQ